MSGLLQSTIDTLPENLSLIKQLDTLWMFAHALKIVKSPMWMGLLVVSSKILMIQNKKFAI